jgi:streptomycin 6-kinase
MQAIRIPPQLRAAGEDEHQPERCDWLDRLPAVIAEVAGEWELELGEPYLPGGQCAWVAPAVGRGGELLALKVGWRHHEAEHEPEALRLLDGDGAVRCIASRRLLDTTALLLERCVPGTQLRCQVTEPQQDLVIAGLLRRVWEQGLPSEKECPFRPLSEMWDQWTRGFEARLLMRPEAIDRGLADAAIALMRELPVGVERDVLLCTDLHAGNVLSSEREPWLMIDPKPFVGDPAYDVVQHMLNCDERLYPDPVGLAERMADLLDLDRTRVRQWLFVRCTQESLFDQSMRRPAVLLGQRI